MAREGHFHDGISLQWDRQCHHVDIRALTGGKRVTVYPQHEAQKDLIAKRIGDGGEIIFGIGGTTIHGVDTGQPSLSFRRNSDGKQEVLHCDYLVGTDGFHGPGRQAIAPSLRTE